MTAPIPVTVITGFLGSGKTTLLGRLLSHSAMAGTAVIINEYGEVALDHWLVESGGEELITLGNGCVCCSLRGDLVSRFRRLLINAGSGQGPAFRRIVIETTGLADPAPIVHTLMQDPLLSERCVMDGIVTLVDAVHAAATLDAHPAAATQVAMADRILITKADLVAPAALAEVRCRVQAVNPSIAALPVEHGRVEPDAILHCGPGTGGVAALGRWLPGQTFAPLGESKGLPDRHRRAGIETLLLEPEAPVSRAALERFMDLLCETWGDRLLRCKGIIAVTDDPTRPAVVHAVRHQRHPVGRLPAWPVDLQDSRLVCIGERLQEDWLRGLWASCAGG